MVPLTHQLQDIQARVKAMFCKSRPAPPPKTDIATSSMTAEEFAQAVGITIQVVSDADEDAVQCSILSSSTPSITYINTCPPSNSYQKLDLNIFVPPSSQMVPVPPKDSHHKRSASVSYPYPASAPTYLPKSRRASVASIQTIDEYKRIETKGRFTMTSERSSHWHAKVPTIHRSNSQSRFTLVDNSDTLILNQPILDTGRLHDCPDPQDTTMQVLSQRDRTGSLDSQLTL